MKPFRKLLPLCIVGLVVSPAANAVILNAGAEVMSSPVTTLNYIGPQFNSVSGFYSTNDFVSGSFVLDGVLPANANYLSVPLSSLSVSDQHQTFTEADGLYELRLWTSPTASITGWDFYFRVSSSIGIDTIFNPSGGGSGFDRGFSTSANSGSWTGTGPQGTWTISTVGGPVVPEPTTVALLGIGLVAAGVARRRKRKA